MTAIANAFEKAKVRPTLTLRKPDVHPFIREFSFKTGTRKIAVARTAITFVCADKEDPENACVIGLRNASAVPVKGRYDDVLAWWLYQPKRDAK